jgi:hypothetical protein
MLLGIKVMFGQYAVFVLMFEVDTSHFTFGRVQNLGMIVHHDNATKLVGMLTLEIAADKRQENIRVIKSTPNHYSTRNSRLGIFCFQLL